MKILLKNKKTKQKNMRRPYQIHDKKIHLKHRQEIPFMKKLSKYINGKK